MFALAALAWILGAGSLILFGLFLWAGNLRVIDLRFSEGTLLIWDSALCLAFFLQHSILIRRSARAKLRKLIPGHCFGAAYTIASGVVLATLVILWQPSRINVYTLSGVARLPLRLILLLAFAGVIWGILALERFDAFGSDALVAHARGKQLPPVRLIARGPYRLVRHPFYLSAIVAFWATPVLSADRLLFNLLFTIWTVVGAILEERDLLEEFGEDYARYRRAVPMFLPAPWKPRYLQESGIPASK